MLQRTIYSGVIGMAAVLGLIAAFLPWARVEGFSISGLEEGGLRDSLVNPLLSLALGGLVIWFWFEEELRRVRVASILISVTFGVLLGIAGLNLADMGRILGYQPPTGADAGEGLYLAAAAGLVGFLGSSAALLTYDPQKDRERFQGLKAAVGHALAPALPWFLRLAAIIYAMGLAAFLQAASTSSLDHVFNGSFTLLIISLAAFGLFTGLATGLGRKFSLTPIIVSWLLILAYGVFLLRSSDPRFLDIVGFENGYWEIGSDNLVYVTGAIYGATAALVVVSVPAGVGMAQLCRGVMALARKTSWTAESTDPSSGRGWRCSKCHHLVRYFLADDHAPPERCPACGRHT